uniref:C1q domain-containing protein n=1 Tax=Neogobius melanostomus TaxID=47308 RepID=A0A8C6T6C2_9GOBI
MERVSVLCLSLLLCSLSGAEIIEEREISPESVNVPQPGPSDLHAVLREMSAKLAENRLMIQQLQTLNQEQAAKLKELENQVDTKQQEQAAKLKELKKQVDTQQQAQASELKSLKTRTNVTENQVESLRRDRAVGQVAFSASLLESGSRTLGPFSAQIPLVFKHVVSNIGKAYSPHTGIFTAPVRGAYHFEFYFVAYGGSHSSAVGLVKNGEHIFIAGQHQTNGWGTSANGVTLLLEAGDVVFLRLWQGYVIYDDESHHSTFSGHLLFPCETLLLMFN